MSCNCGTLELITDNTLECFPVVGPTIVEIVIRGPQGPAGSGSGGTIEETDDILQGDGAGNAESAGFTSADVVLKATGSTPTTLNEVIELLQDRGLCS